MPPPIDGRASGVSGRPVAVLFGIAAILLGLAALVGAAGYAISVSRSAAP
jgi:hypothetical protein